MQITSGIQPITFLAGATATGVGVVRKLPLGAGTAVLQVWVKADSGATTAGVTLWGSNDPTCRTSQSACAKTSVGTLALSGTGAGDTPADVDALSVTTQFAFYWVEITGISGTNANVTAVAAA